MVAQPNRTSIRKSALALTLAGPIVILGSFTTWGTASDGIASVSVSGTDHGGDGWITLVCGAIGLLIGILSLARRRRGWAVAALLAFLVGGATAGYDMATLSQNLSGSSGIAVSVTPGFGIWLCVLGSIAGFVAACFEVFQPARRSTMVLATAAGVPGSAYGGVPAQQAYGGGMPAQQAGPPAWFPDPTRQHRYRFYNGYAWTEAWSDDATPPPPPAPA
jgi:hypothetical protein